MLSHETFEANRPFKDIKTLSSCHQHYTQTLWISPPWTTFWWPNSVCVWMKGRNVLEKGEKNISARVGKTSVCFWTCVWKSACESERKCVAGYQLDVLSYFVCLCWAGCLSGDAHHKIFALIQPVFETWKCGLTGGISLTSEIEKSSRVWAWTVSCCVLCRVWVWKINKTKDA